MSALYKEADTMASLGLLLKIVHSNSRLIALEVKPQRWVVPSWPDKWNVRLYFIVEKKTIAEAEEESLGTAAYKVVQEYLRKANRTIEEFMAHGL